MGVPERRSQLLEALLATFLVLPFGLAEARKAAQIRVSLEKKGMPIGPTDIPIAATAMANRGVLVTHNGSEFSRVEDPELVDWL
jgi:tRNA(fMet)-specific endonuclease VapC